MTASENRPLPGEMDVDALLAEAADEAPPMLEAAFLSRLMADADRLQPPVPMPAPVRTVAPPLAAGRQGASGGLIGALADVFGGRGVLAGMMLATVGGLYIGLAQPALVGSLTGLTSETPIESFDLISGSDSFWTEATQ